MGIINTIRNYIENKKLSKESFKTLKLLSDLTSNKITCNLTSDEKVDYILDNHDNNIIYQIRDFITTSKHFISNDSIVSFPFHIILKEVVRNSIAEDSKYHIYRDNIIILKHYIRNLPLFISLIKLINQIYKNYQKTNNKNLLEYIKTNIHNTFFINYFISKVIKETIVNDLLLFFESDSGKIFEILNLAYLKDNRSTQLSDYISSMKDFIPSNEIMVEVEGEDNDYLLQLGEIKNTNVNLLFSQFNINNAIFIERNGFVQFSFKNIEKISKISLRQYTQCSDLFNYTMTESIDVDIYDIISKKWKYAGCFQNIKENEGELCLNENMSISKIRIYSKYYKHKISISYIRFYRSSIKP